MPGCQIWSGFVLVKLVCFLLLLASGTGNARLIVKRGLNHKVRIQRKIWDSLVMHVFVLKAKPSFNGTLMLFNYEMFIHSVEHIVYTFMYRYPYGTLNLDNMNMTFASHIPM